MLLNLPSPLSQTVTPSGTPPPRAWRTLWTAPMGVFGGYVLTLPQWIFTVKKLSCKKIGPNLLQTTHQNPLKFFLPYAFSMVHFSHLTVCLLDRFESGTDLDPTCLRFCFDLAPVNKRLHMT